MELLLGHRPPSNFVKTKRKIIRETDFFEIYSDSVYKNSEVFLKGTITKNPQNDYSQHFLDTQARPQNYIMDTSMRERYLEYPKLRELMRLKDEFSIKRNHPPFYLRRDLRRFDLKQLKNQFDVILIEPPLREYVTLHPGLEGVVDFWSWDEIAALEINAIASPRSFIFLWCGSYEGLEEGRRCFRDWGFRRCEDICWVKTNIKKKHILPLREEGSLFQHTKEHLLMGIRGTIRRSSDIDFIHANVDIDVVLTEEPPTGCLDKPEEIFYIIEHFCMGRRRLHLFGSEKAVRPGWVTVSPDVVGNTFDPDTYAHLMSGDNAFMGTLPEIEALRPKSPSQRPPQTGGGA